MSLTPLDTWAEMNASLGVISENLVTPYRHSNQSAASRIRPVSPSHDSTGGGQNL